MTCKVSLSDDVLNCGSAKAKQIDEFIAQYLESYFKGNRYSGSIQIDILQQLSEISSNLNDFCDGCKDFLRYDKGSNSLALNKIYDVYFEILAKVLYAGLFVNGVLDNLINQISEVFKEKGRSKEVGDIARYYDIIFQNIGDVVKESIKSYLKSCLVQIQYTDFHSQGRSSDHVEHPIRVMMLGIKLLSCVFTLLESENQTVPYGKKKELYTKLVMTFLLHDLGYFYNHYLQRLHEDCHSYLKSCSGSCRNYNRDRCDDFQNSSFLHLKKLGGHHSCYAAEVIRDSIIYALYMAVEVAIKLIGEKLKLDCEKYEEICSKVVEKLRSSNFSELLKVCIFPYEDKKEYPPYWHDISGVQYLGANVTKFPNEESALLLVCDTLQWWCRRRVGDKYLSLPPGIECEVKLEDKKVVIEIMPDGNTRGNVISLLSKNFEEFSSETLGVQICNKNGEIKIKILCENTNVFSSIELSVT